MLFLSVCLFEVVMIDWRVTLSAYVLLERLAVDMISHLNLNPTLRCYYDCLTRGGSYWRSWRSVEKKARLIHALSLNSIVCSAEEIRDNIEASFHNKSNSSSQP